MGVHAAHVDELKERLRALGLRATSVRLGVLGRLHAARRPMTHDEVMDALGDGEVDAATVYRVLSDLAEAGLLRRMDLGDKKWRYELDDACRGVVVDHPHFLCDACHVVVCLPQLQLRVPDGALPAELVGAELNVRLSGRCGRCVGEPPPSAR